MPRVWHTVMISKALVVNNGEALKGEGRKADAHDAASEEEERSQRIDCQRNHSANCGDEAPSESHKRCDQANNANKGLIVCHRWRTAETLRCDKVGREREDNDGAEDLWNVSAAMARARIGEGRRSPRSPEEPYLR